MWPSEPGLSDLAIVLFLPIGASIMLIIGLIVQAVKDHKHG